MEDRSIWSALTDLFTDDPVNWVKWGMVFAVLIAAYIPALKLYSKAEYRLSRERKADKPKALGQVVQGRLIQERNSYKEDSAGRRTDWCHAKYEYTLEGETRIYRALFKDRGAPGTLTLYYNRPHRMFSLDEYHWENHKGCVFGLILFLPWFAAAMVGVLLNIPGVGGN